MSTDMQVENHGFTPEQEEMLHSPLDASLIKQRPDGKKYLKGSTEFDAANRIFGYGRWGYKVIGRTLQKVYDLDDKVVGLYFYVEVELYVAGSMFPFYGDGGQSVVAYNAQGYENASKGATTDAVKRALRHYGDQFGLCLYDEDSLVDAGDGMLVKVKEVKVASSSQQPAKRIVEAQNGTRQIEQPDPIKSRLNSLYERAVALRLYERVADPKENARLFLEWVGSILKSNITAPGQLTASRLDTIEQYINSKDAA